MSTDPTSKLVAERVRDAVRVLVPPREGGKWPMKRVAQLHESRRGPAVCRGTAAEHTVSELVSHVPYRHVDSLLETATSEEPIVRDRGEAPWSRPRAQRPWLVYKVASVRLRRRHIRAPRAVPLTSWALSEVAPLTSVVCSRYRFGVRPGEVCTRYLGILG